MGSPTWWRHGVIYQVYPRSFQDSDGDGVGDLRGLISRLDYLRWLGIDAIWLTPITVSPDKDMGYDVSDYCEVQPAFGDLGTVDELIREAGSRDIKVVLDIVPNHSSDQHPWFIDSRSSRSARRRDWYIWADPKPDGSPPNNWLSIFGGPAWTFDKKTGQYYLHNFLPEQPDLNWWNAEVRDAFDVIYRFWFDHGVAGFRIDVAHGIVKDRELRDNPVATEADPPQVRAHGQRMIYNFERPEAHEVLRRWRTLANSYDPPRILLGETYVLDIRTMGRFYGTGYVMSTPQPGWAESDPEDWWTAAGHAVREAAGTHASEIAAIGLSGQMHGVVLSDDTAHPLRPAILWADTRARRELEAYAELSSERRRSLGNPPATGMAGPSLLWLRHHERPHYRQAQWALQPKDWLRLRMIHEAATEPSDASGTLLYDLTTDYWATEVIEELDLRLDFLAPIRESVEICGVLTRSAAEYLGLRANLPVVGGAADTAASALAGGLLDPGPIQLTIGS